MKLFRMIFRPNEPYANAFLVFLIIILVFVIQGYTSNITEGYQQVARP